MLDIHISSVRRAVLAVALVLVFAPVTALEAQVPDRASAVEMRKQFLADLDTLQSKMLQLANAIPADKYSWRPAPGVRSIGEAFMHVASEYYVFTPMAYGAARSPVIPRGQEAFTAFEASSTKPDVLKHLNEGYAYMKSNVAGLDATKITGSQKLFGRDLTILETSLIMSADLHEHLGQLIAYARVNGIKPPWTK